MKSISLLIALLAFACTAQAGTAVCKNAAGRAFGQRGPELHGKRVDEPDGITGATFIISWEKNSSSVTTADKRTKRNLKQQATLVHEAPDQVALVAVDSSNVVWLYSVFPKEQVALISLHDTDASSHANGGAIARSFLATCTISE